MRWSLKIFAWRWRADQTHQDLWAVETIAPVRLDLHGHSDAFHYCVSREDTGEIIVDDQTWCDHWHMTGARVLIVTASDVTSPSGEDGRVYLLTRLF